MPRIDTAGELRQEWAPMPKVRRHALLDYDKRAFRVGCGFSGRFYHDARAARCFPASAKRYADYQATAPAFLHCHSFQLPRRWRRAYLPRAAYDTRRADKRDDAAVAR